MFIKLELKFEKILLLINVFIIYLIYFLLFVKWNQLNRLSNKIIIITIKF